MFINQDRSNKIVDQVKSTGAVSFFQEGKGLKITIISLVALLILAAVVTLIVISQRQVAQEQIQQQTVDAGNKLPEAEEAKVDYLLGESGFEKLQAEQVVFGSFYRQPDTAVEVKNLGVSLPINVKTEADNYYSLSREIDLDEVIDDLNANGLAVMNNPFTDANNFYSFYQALRDRNIPFLLTNDFLIYYYQNSLKYIFKQIEADIFYQDFWEINKYLFELADKRYRERSVRLGILNDPVLEAERLEAAYFAVSLELLKPKTNQILKETDKDYVDQNKFTTLEAERYDFTIPEYLRVDVEKEIELINKGDKNNGLVKSPIMLYDRNYSLFTIPPEYRTKGKLYNFYLANQWANTLFPLYYQNDNCPECLLDQEDWQINFIAAQLISQDFNQSQTIMNKWAKIYKVLSYFIGLRDELTYLHYKDALNKSFGPQADLEKILASNNPEKDNNLQRLQEQVASYSFDPAQGGYLDSDATERAARGMRLLQDKYWPDRYIYQQLLFEPVGAHLTYNSRIADKELLSVCAMSTGSYRCRPTIFDIINIVFKDQPAADSYFAKNTNYEFYQQRLRQVREHYGQFDDLDWHNNGFWSVLDIDRVMLEDRTENNWPYTKTAAWTEISLNAAAAALLNQQLPIDEWEPAYKKETIGLADSDNIVKYNYVEPSLSLISELLANGRMLFKTLYSLDLIDVNDAQFSTLLNNLITLRELVVKELADEELNFDDWRFINNLAGQYYITKPGERSQRISENDPISGKQQNLEQRLGDLQLLLSVQNYQNRQLILVGPIFNYQEIKR